MILLLLLSVSLPVTITYALTSSKASTEEKVSYLKQKIFYNNTIKFENTRYPDGLIHCRTGFRCYDDECYPGLCYKNECRNGNNRDCCCYQCRPGAPNHVCERQGKRFCDGYKCTNCISDNDCSSDTSCDQICSNGECVIRSNLNCQTLLSTPQHCLVYQHKCVDCLNDDHCRTSKNGSTPFCDTKTNTCERCNNDLQCRSNDNCNANCNTTYTLEHHCYNPNEIDICNTTIELCSINEGECKEKCTSNSNCTSENPVCNIQTGACDQCLENNDCSNCFAKCTATNNVYYHQKVCIGGFKCSSSIINLSYLLLFLFIIF